MVPLHRFSGVLLLGIALAFIPTPAFALPDQVFWDHNDWPSDLESVSSGSPVLEGTVLFAQSQIIPSKHRVENDDQPHLTALKRTLVMLRPHDINDQSVSMELSVRDADGNKVSDSIVMEVPEKIPKQEGWVYLDDIEFPDNDDNDCISIDIEIPTELENPYVVEGQYNLDIVGDDPQAVELANLLRDYNEIKIQTADGSWKSDFYLPDGSDIPPNSKVHIKCDSGWDINIHYENSQTGGLKKKALSQGEALIVVFTSGMWWASEDVQENECTSTEFPTELKNPHVVEGQTNLDDIGDDPQAVGLSSLLNDHEEVKIKTADGSWVGDFYLPVGSGVPSSSKIQVVCDSTWDINVHYANAEGVLRKKTLSRGDALIVALINNVWLASDDLENGKIPFVFPTELKNPYVVQGQNNLDNVGDDPDAVGLTSLLKDNSEIEIQTADGSWMRDFYLPKGSEVTSNSRVQFTCDSGYNINVYYLNPQTGLWRRKILAQGDVLIVVLIDDMWLAAEDLEHNEYIFGHNFYTAILEREWVAPGMSLEFAASSGERGVLDADVGGVTELVITTLDAGFLTEPRNEFKFRDDPTANTEYFETTWASRLVVAQYETMQFEEIVLPNGKEYTSVSDDEGGVHSGDMRELVGKILLSHGVDLANYGISSSLAQSESPHPFTCAFLAAHNTVGMYQNGRVVHGLSGGNGMITLLESIGNEMSHETGHNYGLGHFVGGFNGSVHRGADEINSSWAWDSRSNTFLPNFSPSNTGKDQCFEGQCEPPFLGKYQYGTDSMAGGEPLWGTNRFTMYTPHVSRLIQDFLESKAVWDPSSSTGFRKYNPDTRQMEEFINYDNGQKVPRLYRVPVTTLVGYYDPDPSRALKSYIYPALHGAYGFVYNDDGGSDSGTSNGCELVVQAENREEKLVYTLDTFIDWKGMNKFHVNIATQDTPTKAWIYCKNKLLHSRELMGPNTDEPPLTYTLNGVPFDDSPNTPPPAAPPTASPTVSPTPPPTAPPTASPTVSPTPPPTAPPTASPMVSPTPPPTAPPTASPTVSPTPPPAALPTASPTVSPTSFDCKDKDVAIGKKKKDCNWVGKPSKTKKVIRRCKRKVNQIRVWDWCPTTCGKVGLGKCPATLVGEIPL